jgi:hypothetical protein
VWLNGEKSYDENGWVLDEGRNAPKKLFFLLSRYFLNYILVLLSIGETNGWRSWSRTEFIVCDILYVIDFSNGCSILCIFLSRSTVPVWFSLP